MTLPELEKRLKEMEGELASLKDKVDTIQPDQPWWERIAGSFAGDETYARAMELGQEHRQSQRPADAVTGEQP